MLNAIGENPAEYKKNTVWNIQKIQEEIAKVIDFPRSDSTIKEYMRKNFSLPPKKLILWADHPEEVAYLKELFDTYYEVGKKLPTCDIKNQLNARFHHQRTQFAVENYIRAHFKSSEERQLQDNPLRTNEEKNFIRNIIAHKSEYTYSSTSHG